MTVQQHDPSHQDPNLTLRVSAAASQHFIQQLDKKKVCIGVRVSVNESGCSGYQYALDWITTANLEDIQINLNNQYAVYIAPEALTLIQGTEILLKKEGLNETIEFQNPNVTGTCGCGESFSIHKHPTDPPD